MIDDEYTLSCSCMYEYQKKNCAFCRDVEDADTIFNEWLEMKLELWYESR